MDAMRITFLLLLPCFVWLLDGKGSVEVVLYYEISVSVHIIYIYYIFCQSTIETISHQLNFTVCSDSCEIDWERI